MEKKICSAIIDTNGRKLNKGEFVEMALAVNGFGIRGYRKYSTAFYTASDIEANGERYSVKSNQASLSDLCVTTKNNDLGKQYIIEGYMAVTNSTQFIYASHIDDTIVYYIMNREEFSNLLKESSKSEKEMLKEAIKKLTPRERQIMSLRFGLNGEDELTQKEVADMLGISQSYISRLEKKIVLRLRKEFMKLA